MGEIGQKLIFICSVLSNLGDLRDRKGQKPNIFLKCGCKVGAGCGSACLHFGVSTGAGGQAFGGCPLLSWRVPSFCPFLCLALGALLANMALFRILRGF